MKRLLNRPGFVGDPGRFIPTIVFLCGVVFAANVFAMSDSEKQRYLDWVKNNLNNWDNTSEIVLAMAPNGCWSMGYDNFLHKAKRSAIRECKRYCKVSSCEIVDRNGRSDFIKMKGMSFPADFKFKLSSNGFQKGEAYRNGEGVAKNYKEAIKWYKEVVDEKPLAAFWIGSIYTNGGYGITKDYGEAFKWYMKCADMGDAGCQFTVGYHHEYGLVVSKNLEKAVSWYRKSAEQGDYSGQEYLAVCYEKGIGVSKDIDKAIELYRLSAKQGNTRAKDALKRLNVKVSPKSSTSNTSGGRDE